MDGYIKRRSHNRDISGQRAVNTTGATSTLVTAKSANYTIYIQRAYVTVTTGSASVTWSLQDSAATPVSITGLLSVATAPSSYESDYGPEGVALSAGTNLTLTLSATGAAGIVKYDGYMRLSSAVAIGSE